MFKNYLKIAFRNIIRHKGYSFINISGLAIGLVVCILIILWVYDEMSVDRFHEHRDDLYLVGLNVPHEGEIHKITGSPPRLGPALKDEYPEISNSTRTDAGGVSLLLRFRDKTFNENSVKAADPSFLKMFSFPLIKGDPDRALADPYSIVMTESMAQKYFGSKNPIGKIVKAENRYDLVVTGVLKNMPRNSTLRFDFLVPLLFVYDDLWGKGELNSWTNYAFFTYVQLKNNNSYEEFNQKITGGKIAGNLQTGAAPFLVPFADLYLYGTGSGGGHIEQVRMFSMIALCVLLIACINFMNLATARSGSRAKEIGMRKVAGALRRDIVNQFFGEAILFSFIALMVSLVLVSLLLPAFNSLTGKQLVLDFSQNPALLLGLIAVTLFTGIIAGSYPALFLSSFQPNNILRKSFASGSKGASFRKTLVVLQFSLSTILIIGTLIISKQLHFMQNKDLGFDKKDLVYFALNRKIYPISGTVKTEILRHPAISRVSLTSFTPIGFYSSDDDWNWQGKNPAANLNVRRFCTDFDFLATFKARLVQGQFFSPENTGAASFSRKIVINETFARIIGNQNPVGMRLTLGSQNFQVIGVIKDFNFSRLNNEIAPLAIFYKTENPGKNASRYRYMFMKVDPDKTSSATAHIEKVYKKYSPEYPFSYGFLDETFGQLYNGERRLGLIFTYFAVIAVFISCLGLFGLASFMTEQRTKEMGIRKVFGAPVANILLLFSKEFIKWVVIANLVAWPAAFTIMRTWLQDFAFRTPIGIEIFILAALLTVVIALLTVSFQSIKAATANPVEALKYE